MTCVSIAFVLQCLAAQMVLATSWKSRLVAEYFRVKNIRSIDAYFCSEEDGIGFYRQMSFSLRSEHLRIPFRIKTAIQPPPIDFRFGYGIFVDTSCDVLLRQLIDKANKEWFGINCHWLILDERGLFPGIEDSFEISVFSDLVITNGTYFTKLSKIWTHLPFEFSQIGIWNNKSYEIHLSDSPVIIDLKNATLRGAFTIVDNIYDRKQIMDQMQDDTFKPDEDSANRLYTNIHHLIADLYSYRLELVISETFGDRCPNGSYNGIMGQLFRNEVDFSLTPVGFASVRVGQAYPSFALVPYWVAAIFRQPRALGTYRALTLEFSSGLWICLFGLGVVGAVLCTLTQQIGENPGDKHWRLRDFFFTGILQSAGILANQGLTFPVNGTPGRITCLSLLVMGFVASTYYNAATTTALLSPSPASINTIEQLIASKMNFIYRNSTIITYTKLRYRIFIKAMLDVMKKGNLDYINDSYDGARYIMNGSALIDEFFSAFKGINYVIPNEIICDLTLFKVGMFFGIGIHIRRDMHLREFLFRGLVKLWEDGLVDRTRHKWQVFHLECQPITQFFEVHLDTIAIAIGILFVGGFLSFLILLGEQIVSRRSKFNK